MHDHKFHSSRVENKTTIEINDVIYGKRLILQTGGDTHHTLVICCLHLLGQRVQGRGVDLAPDVDVDRRRVPGGGRHHGDALPHPRLPLDVRHTGHLII